jgi:Ca-activated chloride channel family protein
MGYINQRVTMIRLADPAFLLIAVMFLPFFFKGKTAFLGYSDISLLEAGEGPRVWPHLPMFVLVLATALLILGLSRPQWQTTVEYERFVARDILLVVDLSHSMEDAIKDGVSPEMKPRKIDVAKKAALQFIQKRNNDRIGLLVFGDETFGSWPMTRDLDLISKKVERLGSTFYGGTNLGKPFLKAIEHFSEMGQSASRILVFLSDGQAMIPEMKKERIIKEMKEKGVRLYLVGINLKEEDSDILDIVARIDGRFIAADSEGAIGAAFEEINRMEPSTVEREVQGKRQDLYPIPVIAALGCLFVVTLLRNTLLVELC